MFVAPDCRPRGFPFSHGFSSFPNNAISSYARTALKERRSALLVFLFHLDDAITRSVKIIIARCLPLGYSRHAFATAWPRQVK